MGCNISQRNDFLDCNISQSNDFLDCNISQSNDFLDCNIQKAESFHRCKTHYQYIPLIYATRKNGWEVEPMATKIWDISPQLILDKFKEEDRYYDYAIMSLNEDVRTFLQNPKNHGNVDSCHVYKCFIKIERLKYLDRESKTFETRYSRAASIDTISWEDSDRINLVADVTYQVSCTVTPDQRGKDFDDCWLVYKFLLIWGTYKDIDQIWRGVPTLRRQSIASVIADLKQRQIIYSINNKWICDKTKLLERIKTCRKKNYIELFTNIDSLKSQLIAKENISNSKKTIR